MNTDVRKSHWDRIYDSKQMNEVSWFQESPSTSIDLIKSFNLDLNASIIDVGGGDGFLVDHLLMMGFKNITVLDISSSAINKAKKRLGNNSSLVEWIVSDISKFIPNKKYDLWHDRAAFHFLTESNEIKHYIRSTELHIKQNGNLIIGTFSENGPLKCSGIRITQYSQISLSELFNDMFKVKESFQTDHKTPLNTIQNFTFCSFIKN
tara:strand:- start:607 stop:1227 length:621 start_codon:yes stop_codon:yes gene_type:complete